MNFSSLPTDNLYKFLALSGVTIVLFAIYLNVRYRAGLWDKIDRARRKLARINAEADALGETNKRLDDLLDAVKGGPPEKISEIIWKREALHKRWAKITALQRTTEVDTAAILRTEGQLRWLNRLSLAAAVLGFAMAGFGFTLWYDRVQVYQDQEIRLKAVQPPDATHGAGQR